MFLKTLAFGCYKAIIFVSRHVSWSEKGLVPDILEKPPPNVLKVKYPRATVKDGAIIPARYTKLAPKVIWNVDKKGTHYSLVMTDIDAPSRQKPFLREWHHWLVVNIPDNHFEKGDTLTEYIGAGPPKGTGLHRFVFLLLKQPNSISFPSYRISKTHYKGRPKFQTQTFIKKYNMEIYAGTFFEAEYDEFVDEVHKQIRLAEYLDLTKSQTF
ncbi:protein D2-like [Diorhabda carinulata]|uniref:protein D2-like n=1 Tax=Diorhabda carinulata TaxID=1163345 RepID=UPI0025A1BF63|nr:protein D2-like [Diorhabda carinulata]